MKSTRAARHRTGKPLARGALALGAALCVTLALGLTAAVAAGPNVPYDLPVTLPSSVTAPSVDASAPYTPAVLSLISQMEAPPLTLAKIQNVDTLVHDGSNTTCHNVGPVSSPVGLDAAGNPTATTLSAATIVGATNIKVASVTGLTAGQTIWIDVTSDAEQATILNVGTAGATGTGVDVTAPLTKAHASGRAVYASLTTPSIAKICWTDAQGVLNTSGPNTRGSTGPMTLMGIGASMDRQLGNAWGQLEGTESREFMVTGMFGPQTDLDRILNWGRNLTTTGEDPYLSHEMVAAQINGMQGSKCPAGGTIPATGAACTPGAFIGAMSQMKHFVVYNGQNQNANTDISDQGLHELYMTPYEGGFVGARAAATMCSYQIWRDTSASPLLANPATALASGISPYANAGENPQSWKLNESHFSCEQPLSLNYQLRTLWGSAAFVGSDYPATHSTSAITNGMDQEMPTANGFLAGGNGTNDPTGSTCAYFTGNPGGFTAGNWDPNCTSDSSHVGGLPNGFQGGSTAAGCAAPPTATGAGGCTLNAAVAGGVLPISVFNQSVARVLYQEQRFGMLGCDPTPGPTCTNPGGVAADRTGTAALPLGSDSGTPVLGTKNGDAAIVEKYSEEGATLLKNSDNALPLTSADLAGGILVTGSSANHTVADPTNEASTGFIDRDAVNPLQQLKALSGNPNAFTFVPANDPTGAPVPCGVTNNTSPTGAAPAAAPPASCDATSGLQRSSGATTAALANDQVDQKIDYTTAAAGQLAGSKAYQWSGWVYVPTADTYTWSLQYSSTVPNANVTFAFDNAASPATGAPVTHTRANAATVYGATTPGTPTNAGYTEALLTNQACSTGTTTTTCATSPTVGWHAVQITLDASTIATPVSFRFSYSRVAGDTADAAAAAAGKSKAIVFVNTGSGANSSAASPAGTPYDGHTISAVEAMSAANVNLITAVGAANPNTIVVINSDNPVDTSWSGSAKSIVEMWFASQEGGTSTARVLLGQANPSGHTVLTWPANRTDTIWGYNEPANGLYPGDAAGQHLERLNGNAGCGGTGNAGSLACPAAGNTTESEGIFTGYRYYDKLGIPVAYPFGWGLSYSDFTPATSFAWGGPAVTPTADGGLDVKVKIRNGNTVPGADTVQVYVGAPDSPTAGVQYAVRSLAQFERVEVPARTSGWPYTVVTLHVAPRALSHWSETDQRWVRDSGTRTIYAGDADTPSHLISTSVNVPATPGSGAFECSNATINSTKITGDVTVPAGSWCDLSAVTVSGNVIVKSTSGVRIRNSSIGGNLVSNAAAGASNPQASGTDLLCGTHVSGDLQLLNSGAGAGWNVGGVCGGNTVGGDFQFNSNGAASSITGNTVTGDLKCAGNIAVTGSGNTAAHKRGQCSGL